LTTFRYRRARKLQLRKRLRIKALLAILQTRRPIKNGVANVWEEDRDRRLLDGIKSKQLT
jgi:hypothetical protein